MPATRAPIRFTLTVESEQDEQGQSTFCLTWTDQYGKHRGQYYRASVTETANGILSRGDDVHIVPYGA